MIRVVVVVVRVVFVVFRVIVRVVVAVVVGVVVLVVVQVVVVHVVVTTEGPSRFKITSSSSSTHLVNDSKLLHEDHERGKRPGFLDFLLPPLSAFGFPLSSSLRPTFPPFLRRRSAQLDGRRPRRLRNATGRRNRHHHLLFFLVHVMLKRGCKMVRNSDVET